MPLDLDLQQSAHKLCLGDLPCLALFLISQWTQLSKTGPESLSTIWTAKGQPQSWVLKARPGPITALKTPHAGLRAQRPQEGLLEHTFRGKMVRGT